MTFKMYLLTLVIMDAIRIIFTEIVKGPLFIVAILGYIYWFIKR